MNERKAKGIRFIAIGLAALTYALAVVYGDVMFLSVVSHAFPTGFLAGLAVAGAVATALSALVLPIALHFWFSPGTQFYVGIGYWIADVLVLALNSILAYAIATGSTDSWLMVWREISPATPLLAVLGWGLVFLFDQSHQLRHAQLGLEADQAEAYAERLAAAARSEVVTGVINAGAQDAALQFARQLTGVQVTTPTGKMLASAGVGLAPQHGLTVPHSANGHGPAVPPLDPKVPGR